MTMHPEPEWSVPFQHRVTLRDPVTGRLVSDFGYMGRTNAEWLADDLVVSGLDVSVEPAFATAHAHAHPSGGSW